MACKDREPNLLVASLAECGRNRPAAGRLFYKNLFFMDATIFLTYFSSTLQKS